MNLRMIHVGLHVLTAALYVLVDLPVSVLTRGGLDHEDCGPVEW